jgi:hypothetical protein
LDLAPAFKESVLPQTPLIVFLLQIKVISEFGMPSEIFDLALDFAFLS